MAHLALLALDPQYGTHWQLLMLVDVQVAYLLLASRISAVFRPHNPRFYRVGLCRIGLCAAFRGSHQRLASF